MFDFSQVFSEFRALHDPNFCRVLESEKAWQQWDKKRSALHGHLRQNHRTIKSTKDCDRSLKRDLESGWLFPTLFQIDSLLWGRWNYWQHLQLVPESAIAFLQAEPMLAIVQSRSPRKPKDIPGFVERVLPTRGIPQIEFGSQASLANKVLENCIGVLEYSRYRMSAVELFLDWFLWSVGHPGFGFPSGIKPEESMLLYQMFDVGMLSLYPYDYMGEILGEAMSKGKQSQLGFFPTPMTLAKFMTKISVPEDEDRRLTSVYEPSLGTGVFGLLASNHSLSLTGQDIDLVVLKAALFQFYIYCPWYAIPIWWLEGDILWGNSLGAEKPKSLCRERFGFNSGELQGVESEGGEFERRIVM